MAAAIQTTIPAEFVADDSDPVVSKDYDVQPYAPPMAKPTVVTLANMVVAGRVPTHRAKRPCTEGYRVIGYTDTTFSTFRGVYTRCGPPPHGKDGPQWWGPSKPLENRSGCPVSEGDENFSVSARVRSRRLCGGSAKTPDAGPRVVQDGSGPEAGRSEALRKAHGRRSGAEGARICIRGSKSQEGARRGHDDPFERVWRLYGHPAVRKRGRRLLPGPSRSGL
jgi:hypothetical protein